MQAKALPSTALALAVPNDEPYRLALEPSNLEGAYKLAAMAAKLNLCGVTSPEDALVRMMAGREQGLTTFQSLQKVYVIEGRPAFDASFVVARALRHPLCEYIRCIETTPTKCVYIAKRKNMPEQKLEWSIDKAKTAGLLDRGKDPSKNNWNRYPDAMLRARCSVAICKIVFPDADLPLTREEIDEGQYGVPTAPDSGDTIDATVVQAEQRDFDAEAEAILEEIQAAQTDDERKALRDKIKGFDGGEPYISELKKAYKSAHPANAQPAAESA